MPDRIPPIVNHWSHEVNPENDVDWTLSPDPAKEQSLRHERNKMLKQDLLLGKPVMYRSSGWSLYPRVHPNDQCTYEPVTSANEVNLQDIVFCEVQPGNRLFAHIVTKIEKKGDDLSFTISNIKGRVNGWCRTGHIYGRLINVAH